MRKFLGIICILLALRFLSIITLDYVAPPEQTNHVPAVTLPLKASPLKASPPKATITPGLKLDSHHLDSLDAIQKNATLCPKTARPTALQYRNKVWHMYQNHNQEIHIYSAFFDDRPAIGVLPYVRLLAVATPTDKPLYCQLWYNGIKNPLVVKIEIKASGRGDKIRGIKYGQYQYSCPLQYANPVPTHVSVSIAPCDSTTILVPIQTSTRGTWSHEFGVCVAIAFGQVPWHELIEWIELTRMQGVSEINIYNGSMHQNMRPLFKYYEDQGLVRLHQMPPPQFDYSKMGAKLSSPASLNDCMLRYMYRYKYIIVIDFDEIIVPRLDENYHDMLARIDKEHKLGEPWLSYTFRNLYFFNDHAPQAGPSYSTMLRYRKRNKDPSGYLFAPKSFIDPRRCESVFNHYCYIKFKNSHTPKKWTIDVNTDIAMSHHYRKCSFKRDECDKMISEAEQDDVMLRFNSSLITRMSKVFKDLNYTPP